MKAIRRSILLGLPLIHGTLAAQDTHLEYAPLGASVLSRTFTPKVTRYELVITDTVYNFTGKPRKGYAVNGRFPMPTLAFTEGDTALIIVHNRMAKEETSLHWHGIILPNRSDGVPYLTTPPIKAGETQEYKFPLIQREPIGTTHTPRCKSRTACTVPSSYTNVMKRSSPNTPRS